MKTPTLQRVTMPLACLSALTFLFILPCRAEDTISEGPALTLSSTDIPEAQVLWRTPIGNGSGAELSSFGSKLLLKTYPAGPQLLSPDGQLSELPPAGESPASYDQIAVMDGNTLLAFVENYGFEDSAGKRKPNYLRAFREDGSVVWETAFPYTGEGQRLAGVTQSYVLVNFGMQDAQDSSDQHIKAFDHKGQLQFEFTASAYDDRSIYEGSEGRLFWLLGNQLKCCNAQGQEQWSYSIDDFSNSSILVPGNGLVYAVESYGDEIIALDMDGRLRWRSALDPENTDGYGGTGARPICAPDGTTYALSSYNKITALDRNGKHMWARYVNGGTEELSRDSEGHVYINDGYSGLLVLDSSGNALWRYSSLANMNSAALVGSDGTVYAVNGNEVYALAPGPDTPPAGFDQNLVSFSSLSGPRVKWTFDVDNAAYFDQQGDFVNWATAPVVAPSGDIYVSTAGRGFQVLSPEGKLLWQSGSGDNSWGWGSKPFAVGPAGQIFSTEASWDEPAGGTPRQTSSYIFAMDSKGSQLWRRDLPTTYNFAYVASCNAGIVLLSSDKQLSAFDLEGNPLWTYQLKDFLNGVSTDAAGVSYVMDGTSTALALGRGGELLWRSESDAGGPPARGPQDLVLLESWSGLTALKAADGTQLWYSPFQTSSNFLMSSGAGFHFPVTHEGRIYVGEGSLFAFGADGTQLWSHETGANMQTPSIGPDGTLYSAGYHYGVKALNPDGTVRWSERGLGFVSSGTAVGKDGSVYVLSGSKLIALKPE